jgi:hypothetical protein
MKVILETVPLAELASVAEPSQGALPIVALTMPAGNAIAELLVPEIAPLTAAAKSPDLTRTAIFTGVSVV